jgi:F-type H+-transporting ATPase subunit gamma
MKEIKSKIGAVSNIKKITKTMEMVSVSKMKRATNRAQGSKDYARRALELLVTIAGEKHVSHPLLETGTGDKELVVVIASNKGLCGSYNTNISKALTRITKSKPDTTFDTVTLGKQAEKAARRNGLEIVASFIELNEKTTADEFQTLKNMLVDTFLDGTYRKVHILYTEFTSATAYTPVMTQVLPADSKTLQNQLLDEEIPQTEKEKLALYLFEPNEEEILGIVIPQLVHIALFQMFIESVASEHSARMFAMKNATDSAGEIIEELTLSFNKARQAGITQEISEIVAGAEALQ